MKSELGTGTTFTLHLPVTTAQGKDEPTIDTLHSNRTYTGRILVVDDEKAISSLVANYLQSMGFEADAYLGAQESLNAIETESKNYDAAFIDYTMPGMNGIDLARKISSLLPEIPIILMTGALEVADLADREASGIVEIIRKPFELDLLASVANEQLAKLKRS